MKTGLSRTSQNRANKLLKHSGRQNHRCAYCGIKTIIPKIEDLNFNYHGGFEPPNLATLDHIIPRVKIPVEKITCEHFNSENYIMACKFCNNTRDIIDVDKYFASCFNSKLREYVIQFEKGLIDRIPYEKLSSLSRKRKKTGTC